MASWLRAAEGFLEVVDRKAKQVVPLAPEDLAPGKDKRTPSKLSTAKSRSIEDDQIAEAREDVNSVTVVREDHVNCNLKSENGEVAVKLYVSALPEDRVAKVPNSTEAKLMEEANGLVQGGTSSEIGKSKEARLSRVCAGLSARLQELKAENQQLEELLEQERDQRKMTDSLLYQAQEELAFARSATNAAESEMVAALSSKNVELETLSKDLESERRRCALAEEKAKLLQIDMESSTRNREFTETAMIQSLRHELASAERRAEEERAMHAATRTAAVERETELEQRMAESTAAVMKMQRIVEERTQRAAELEQKLSLFEVECATLNQELQNIESRVLREQKRQPEEHGQAWREEAERARLAQREAEMKLSTLEVECQKLRVQLADANQSSDLVTTQAHMELEKRFRELTELLYLKQTQLEEMASAKGAAVFQLEKESARFKEARAEMERWKRQYAAMGDEEEGNLRSFESINLQQRRPGLRRIVGPSIQTAAKFLDSGAVQAQRYLWRRPLARIFVVFYLAFVHLFLMYLLHRLQERTVSSDDRFPNKLV